MDNQQRIVMMIGITNSGKSRFASELRRMGWRVIGGNLLESLAERQLIDSVQEGKEVIIDKCNLTAGDRSVWFNLFNEKISGVKALQWIAVVMETSLEECIRRLKDSGLDDTQNVHHHAQEFQPPSLAEGFQGIVNCTDSNLTTYFGPARDFSSLQSPSSSLVFTNRILQNTASQLDGVNSRNGRISLRKGEIVLLFDLNGTLTSHTSKRRSSGRNLLRPGTEHLLKLKERFRLGVFSSATVRTVQTVLQMFADKLGEELFDPELVFYRDHTIPIPQGMARRLGLKPWDTLKPLGRLFSDIRRVILFDDDDWKAVRGEESNMVLVPCWEEEEQGDNLVETLVDEILDKLENISESQDVRNFTQSLTNSLSKSSTESRKDPTNNIIPLKDQTSSTSRQTKSRQHHNNKFRR